MNEFRWMTTIACYMVFWSLWFGFFVAHCSILEYWMVGNKLTAVNCWDDDWPMIFVIIIKNYFIVISLIFIAYKHSFGQMNDTKMFFPSALSLPAVWMEWMLRHQEWQYDWRYSFKIFLLRFRQEFCIKAESWSWSLLQYQVSWPDNH